MRFLKVFVLVAAVAGVFASSALAGGYTDASYYTPVGKVGQAYSHRVQWKPGTGCPPYGYSLVGGDLPPGLSVSSDGYITGTPTKAGTFTFYVRNTDNCGIEGEGNAPFVVTIQDGGPPLSFDTSNLAPATANAPYSAALSSSGGNSYTYALVGGTLPPGLTLSADGHITGTPSAAGSFAFSVRVTDQAGRTATRQLTIEVKVPLGIAEAVVPMAEAKRHFSLQLQATGGTAPYRWSVVGALPEGIFLDAEKGLLVGAPAQAGTFPVTVAVTDAASGTKTMTLSLVVAPKLHFLNRTLAACRAGTSYRSKVGTAGGVGAVSFDLSGGRLPRGLTLNRQTGVISGRTKAVGRFTFSVSATDSFGTVSTSYSLVVR